MTVQHDTMPLEYKKHQWLIYPAHPRLLTVGYPLAVAEAQLSGVGVILYESRPDAKDYVTENGYVYQEMDQVVEIISHPFDTEKRHQAYELCDRYDIEKGLPRLEALWFPE